MKVKKLPEELQFTTFGTTGLVRALWPTLAEPSAYKNPTTGAQGKPKFALTALIPQYSEEEEMLDAKIAEVAKAAFGITEGFVNPLKDGDKRAAAYAADGKDYSFLQGHRTLKSSTEFPIQLYHAMRRNEDGKMLALTDMDEVKDLFYSGCHVAVTIKWNPYMAEDQLNGGKVPAITSYLSAVCFIRDGEKIMTGGRDFSDSFSQVQGAVVDMDVE